ncbi:flagellar basal body-associated FliL family protein [Treponema sp. OMZ 805]|uniref:flagellar basal body-associated FliL family protein n=1 Tax=Treponema sp. OMZ 805 TaxID=2726068 RepID=UPI003D8E39FF
MSVYPSDKLFKLLRIVIIMLIAAIVIGTVVAFVKKTKDRASVRQEEEAEAGTAYIPPKEYALYGDLGQLRAVTADNPPITVVIKPFLEYKASDTAFQEELVTKKEALKKSILDWFSLESAYRLSSELPQDIKQTLMERINKQLVLGKIHNIYFEEFVILY